MLKHALIAVGGDIGVLGRHALSGVVQTRTGDLFPFSRLSINVIAGRERVDAHRR